jgi:dihydroorotase
MGRICIRHVKMVNEGKITETDLIINGKFIEKIGTNFTGNFDEEINAEGLHLFPGLIDDQVHFREPGLTHKAEIYTEAKAAVAGGITSFMEMPNTVPNTLTQELLEEKYQRASEVSLANYSFFMGASNDNIEEVLKTDPKNVCGIKIFMGSSTGNMLVDNRETLDNIFSKSELLIAVHCEDEATIRKNTALIKEKYGENVDASVHPVIRNVEACYLSSSMAVELAKKHGTRLHILHISTAKETELFRNDIPLKEKRITAEACIHHLWFSDDDYKKKGNYIKWNPAVKSVSDREGIWKAINDGRIDVIATDHAPHTIEEKEKDYFSAPSGGPLVQHSLPALIEMYHQGKISLVKIAEKAAHNVADCFLIEKRGFIREGYFADLVLVDVNAKQKVTKENILYKCGWSPFEGEELHGVIKHTFVSGNHTYREGKFDETTKGERLSFNR